MGYIFSYWELVSGSGTFANANSASTTFTTGAAATEVRAYFSILVDFPLYTDLACTVPFSGSVNLGTVNIVDGQPVTITTVLYFKANKSRLVPGGYGTGDVNPYTVQTTDNCADGNISRTYLVGEPMGAMAWHPCVYTISITVNAGASSPISFTIHVTGSSDLSLTRQKKGMVGAVNRPHLTEGEINYEVSLDNITGINGRADNGSPVSWDFGGVCFRSLG